MNNADRAARAFAREAARPGAIVGTVLVIETVMGQLIWEDDDTMDVEYHVVGVDFLVNGKIVRIPRLDISQRTYQQLKGARRGDTRPFALHRREADNLLAPEVDPWCSHCGHRHDVSPLDRMIPGKLSDGSCRLCDPCIIGREVTYRREWATV